MSEYKKLQCKSENSFEAKTFHGMVKGTYKINDIARLRVGSYGILRETILLERKRKFLFFTWWKIIDFLLITVAESSIFGSGDLKQVADYMMRKPENKIHFGDYDINTFLK